MIVLVVVAWILTGVILLAVAYRGVFTTAYLLRRAATGSQSAVRERRFAVVIPAHDEELLIRDVIASIRATDYPQGLLDIHVIADNCADRTAERARELGAQVAERHEPEDRGKGQALRWVFRRLDLARADAVALFDADVLVDRNFFRAMSRELDRGRRCLQGYNGIANPGDSALTRLLAVTNVMKNLLFNGGKATLGLSVILSTGIVFAREVIEQVGWESTSIGEDLEQTFHLLERGERIHFVADARTQAQEASTLRQSYTQRQRWATGRRALAGRARRAVFEGIRRRSLPLADAGLDLLMPTYSKLMNWTALALVLAVLLRPWSPWLLAAVGAALAYQVLEIGISLRLMKAGPSFVASLAFAPLFLAWKAGIDALAVLGYRGGIWTRTSRTPGAGSPAAAPESGGSKADRALSDGQTRATPGPGSKRAS
jgi:cellulose synthase/poly-beta-1,6-N-acetylglucosamine synthase-like glycosyltransferase